MSTCTSNVRAILRPRIVLWALALAFTLNCTAQASPVTVEPALVGLATGLTEPLRRIHAKRVIVLDLRGPEREKHPVGKWVADQVSVVLQKSIPEVQVIDRTQLESVARKGKAAANDADIRQEAFRLARSVGADAVVMGSFAKVAENIGISLAVEKPRGAGLKFDPITGGVPISDTIRALSRDPIPSFKGDIAKAGVGGTTVPSCIHCPEPEYSSQARAASYQGTVTLEVFINEGGRIDKVVVIKGPGMGLEDKAVEAVKRWRLKPATNWEGRPVRVTTLVEITFHFYP